MASQWTLMADPSACMKISVLRGSVESLGRECMKRDAWTAFDPRKNKPRVWTHNISWSARRGANMRCVQKVAVLTRREHDQ
jgi:hypothetical protein